MHRGDDEVRTAAFAILSLAQLFHAFNFRVGRRFYFSKAMLANRYLVGAVLISIVLQAVIIYVPALNLIFGTVPLSLEAVEVTLGCSLIPPLLINGANMLGLSGKD
jgi:P-type Ca2+ transporter type 2C